VQFYPWIVLGHVVLVIVALGAHGVSAYSMFAAKSETDRARLGAVLDLSGRSLNLAGWGLLIGVLLGIVAAVVGGHFGRWWPWVSIVVVVLLFGAMTPMASGPMWAVRKALGQPPRGAKPGDPPPEPASDADLAAARARLRPELVAAIGLGGIVILVWLMEFKPF
jgi:hypothetical protein